MIDIFRQKFDKDNTWITSDFHLGHKNMCRGTSEWPEGKGTRDFDTIEEMDNAVIDGYNKTVPKTGTVLMLGDIMFGDKSKLPAYFDRLNCKNIHFVYGNHDKYIRRSPEYQKLFLSCSDYLEIYFGKKLCVLTHYPFEVWNESHKGSYNLAGHSHGSYWRSDLRNIDVGVDTWHYDIHERLTPYTFDEIDKVMRYRKSGIIFPDHHKKETSI